MKNEPFVIERILNAPSDRVWKALTDKNQMKEWYFDIAAFRPEVGFEFEFEGRKDDIVYLHKCKITEVVPGKRLKYSWRYDGFEGNSFVTWELFPVGSKTRLKLTHEGIETFPVHNGDFAKANFAEGWTYIINKSLPKFVEKAAIAH
jgi:uncharacterized protein YndB with AHSA1/START domain